jgi:pilus assembly protein Flp/PilA
MNKFVRFMKDESGATAIEYGLIAAGIGLVLVATAPLVGAQLSALFTSIATALTPAAP